MQFGEELRAEGLGSGTAELLDAFAVLGEISWTDPEDFREALAATLAKSPEDRRLFELCFERFFFRAPERQAIERGLSERRYEGGERLDTEELRGRIRDAIRRGSDGEMRDSARLAIAAFGRQGEGSGVIGVDVQRIRRTLGLRASGDDDRAQRPEPDSVPRERLRLFERHLRRELERGLIERTRSMPPARPLATLDRGLPGTPVENLAAVHRAVAQLRRRLATQGS
ncbi:MAG: CoxE, partial [Solirubrobacterales bacterium]|nr:CoxE [Solirubrobacterales bacterium]